MKSKSIKNNTLLENNIYMSNQKKNNLTFNIFYDSPSIEPFISILGPKKIIPNSIGFFSYSWSSLIENMNIGRYCSLADNIKFMGGRHPIERLTTHPFTCPNPLLSVNEFEEINHYITKKKSIRKWIWEQ